jgi:hypothetical protein
LSDYDRDLDRAKQDRLSSTGGLVSIAYWIARGVSLVIGFVARKLRAR